MDDFFDQFESDSPAPASAGAGMAEQLPETAEAGYGGDGGSRNRVAAILAGFFLIVAIATTLCFSLISPPADVGGEIAGKKLAAGQTNIVDLKVGKETELTFQPEESADYLIAVVHYSYTIEDNGYTADYSNGWNDPNFTTGWELVNNSSGDRYDTKALVRLEAGRKYRYSLSCGYQLVPSTVKVKNLQVKVMVLKAGRIDGTSRTLAGEGRAENSTGNYDLIQFTAERTGTTNVSFSLPSQLADSVSLNYSVILPGTSGNMEVLESGSASVSGSRKHSFPLDITKGETYCVLIWSQNYSSVQEYVVSLLEDRQLVMGQTLSAAGTETFVFKPSVSQYYTLSIEGRGYYRLKFNDSTYDFNGTETLSAYLTAGQTYLVSVESDSYYQIAMQQPQTLKLDQQQEIVLKNNEPQIFQFRPSSAGYYAFSCSDSNVSLRLLDGSGDQLTTVQSNGTVWAELNKNATYYVKAVGDWSYREGTLTVSRVQNLNEGETQSANETSFFTVNVDSYRKYTLTFDDTANYQIYDASGRSVTSGSGSRVQVWFEENQTYFLRLTFTRYGSHTVALSAYDTLAWGEKHSVSEATSNQPQEWKVIPQANGIHSFGVTELGSGTYDTYVGLYDSNRNLLSERNGTAAYSLLYRLDKGQTYYLCTYRAGGRSFSVTGAQAEAETLSAGISSGYQSGYSAAAPRVLRFAPTASGNYQFDVETSGSDTVTLDVYDPEMNLLETQSGTADFIVGKALTYGQTYTLCLYASSGYACGVTAGKQPSATPVETGTTYTVSGGTSASPKRYSFAPASPGIYQVTVSNTSNTVYFRVKDINGNLLAGYSNSSGNFTFGAVGGETLNFETYGYSSSASYRFVVTKSTSYSIYSISSGQTSPQYTISSNGAVYFRFIPTVSGTYRFYSNAGFDSYGEFLNSSFSSLTTDDDGHGGRDFQIDYSCTAGTVYYLKVRGYNSSATGSFRLVCEKR